MKDHMKIYGIPAVTADNSNDGLMSNKDKIKLDNIENNANNYTHPDNVNTRHVTDTQISTWNAKAPADLATTTANGLMSKEDKTKLDSIVANSSGSSIELAWAGHSASNNINFNVNPDWFYNKDGYKTLSLMMNVYRSKSLNSGVNQAALQETKPIFCNVYMSKSDIYGLDVAYTSETQSGVLVYDYLFRYDGTGSYVGDTVAFMCSVYKLNDTYRCTISRLSPNHSCMVTGIFAIIPR